MLRLPFVPRIKPDELLYSYIMRLAAANECDTLGMFTATFLWPERARHGNFYREIPYDINNDLLKLLEAIDENIDPVAFYQKTSIFPGLAPFSSKVVSSHRIGNMCSENKFKQWDATAYPMISEIRICPYCKQEEGTAWYYHRAHQMPGVCVCHKHGLKLLRYNGIKGNEFCDDTELFLEVNGNMSDAVAYARFCKELLDAELDFSLEDTQKVLMPELALVGFKSSYTDTEMAIRVALKKYGTCQKFAETVASSVDNFYNTIEIDNQLTATTSIRENLLGIKCKKCKIEFLTTAYRLAIGWGCPSCDKELTADQAFDRMFKAMGKGDYERISPFNGIQNSIKIKHIKCGKQFSVKARAFIESGERCSCEYRILFDEAKRNIGESGEFELVRFVGIDHPATIRHKECGQSFEWDYYKFLKQPWCRVCIPKGPVEKEFEQKVADLVGDEYVLIGPYIDMDTKVDLLHKTCGRTQTYKVRDFFDGRRCKHCTQFTKDNVLSEIVFGVSNGQYSLADRKTANLIDVINNDDGSHITLSTAKILQELYRPTPSVILPIKDRNLAYQRPIYKRDSIKRRILGNSTHGMLIHLEDLYLKGVKYVDLKLSVGELVNDGVLINVEPGIYRYPEDNFTPWEVVESRFLVRNGKRIGYLTDHAFSYKLGLRTTPPERWGIISNAESQKHGRNRTYHGVDLKLHGSNVKITDENYKILSTIHFLLNYKRLGCVEVGDVYKILMDWLQVDHITEKDFEPYYQYSAKWAPSEIEKVYKVNKND